MDQMQTRVILVDTHPILRDGLRNSLEADGGYTVVGEASDGPSAIRTCENNPYDALIINALLPGSDRLQVLSTIKKNTDRKIIVSSVEQDLNSLHDIRKCGVDGFLGKDASSKEYLAAINTVMQGGVYFSQNIANTFFIGSQSTSEKRNAYGLTERELEVLSMLSSGYCNKEVANKYELSVRTVEAHRLNIRRKTQSNTLSDLVRISRSLGLANMSGNARHNSSSELYNGHSL
jgi:DNA-binding NarL/FixJ family response regulator